MLKLVSFRSKNLGETMTYLRFFSGASQIFRCLFWLSEPATVPPPLEAIPDPLAESDDEEHNVFDDEEDDRCSGKCAGSFTQQNCGFFVCTP